MSIFHGRQFIPLIEGVSVSQYLSTAKMLVASLHGRRLQGLRRHALYAISCGCTDPHTNVQHALSCHCVLDNCPAAVVFWGGTAGTADTPMGFLCSWGAYEVTWAS